MINYDVPWNARLEQRMGRIHRYGQRHDPVVITNLVAHSTREGKVLKVLLDKLEKIRKELQSDKVFDCIGRIFEGVSLKRYMELAVTQDPSEVAQQLDGRLTREQVEAWPRRLALRQGRRRGAELPRLRQHGQEALLPAAPAMSASTSSRPPPWWTSPSTATWMGSSPCVPCVPVRWIPYCPPSKSTPESAGRASRWRSRRTTGI